MKKSNSIKIFIAILFVFTLLSIYSKNEVRATEIETDNFPEPIPLKIVTREDLDRANQRQHVNSENIIVEYDSETGETREINMEDLKQSQVETNVLGNRKLIQNFLIEQFVTQFQHFRMFHSMVALFF